MSRPSTRGWRSWPARCSSGWRARCTATTSAILDVAPMFDIVLDHGGRAGGAARRQGNGLGPVAGRCFVVPLIEFTNSSWAGRTRARSGCCSSAVCCWPSCCCCRGACSPPRRAGAAAARRATASTGARCSTRSVPATLRVCSPIAVGPGDDLLTVGCHDALRRRDRARPCDLHRARAGSVTALIGPNGSGKSTAVQCRSMAPTSRLGWGLAGPLHSTGSVARAAFAGVARTYQLPRLFGSLTVLENVAVVSP